MHQFSLETAIIPATVPFHLDKVLWIDPSANQVEIARVNMETGDYFVPGDDYGLHMWHTYGMDAHHKRAGECLGRPECRITGEPEMIPNEPFEDVLVMADIQQGCGPQGYLYLMDSRKRFLPMAMEVFRKVVAAGRHQHFTMTGRWQFVRDGHYLSLNMIG